MSKVQPIGDVQPAGTKPHGDWATYKRLLRYVAPYWYLLTVSILAFLLAAGAEGYFAKLFGELIDSGDAVSAKVTSLLDVEDSTDFVTTLREAIAHANDGDTITFRL